MAGKKSESWREKTREQIRAKRQRKLVNAGMRSRWGDRRWRGTKKGDFTELTGQGSLWRGVFLCLSIFYTESLPTPRDPDGAPVLPRISDEGL